MSFDLTSRKRKKFYQQYKIYTDRKKRRELTRRFYYEVICTEAIIEDIRLKNLGYSDKQVYRLAMKQAGNNLQIMFEDHLL